MNTVSRSVINRAATALIKDTSKWGILVGREPGKIRAVRNAVQDYRYNGGSLTEVGTALAFCIGYNIIEEDK